MTARGDWRSTLARSGLVAKGVLYGALGLLALQVAAGNAGAQSASKRGAIELVASQPYGRWLLGLLTFGLFALGLWQAILTLTGDPVDGSDKTDRAVYAGKAVIYFAVATTAFRILAVRWGSRAISAGSGSDEQSGDRATAVIMSWPGGDWFVALAGVLILAAAIHQFYKHAWNSRFMRRLNVMRVSSHARTVIERSGQSGYAARAVILAIVGAFFVFAAVHHDPNEPVGLSGALQVVDRRGVRQACGWSPPGYYCTAVSASPKRSTAAPPEYRPTAVKP
jgi:hypothetical protein